MVAIEGGGDDGDLMTFVSAGLASIVVALPTISYHAIKTVDAEPAQILKNE